MAAKNNLTRWTMKESSNNYILFDNIISTIQARS